MATIENQLVFEGINCKDVNDRITLDATTERAAKVEMLDQLGYTIDIISNKFFLIDIEMPLPDENTKDYVIEAANLDEAYDSALRHFGWKISEPTELIGGSLGAGMGFDDQQNGF